MTTISVPLSRPLDPPKADALARIVSVTCGRPSEPMLVGAFARDVWFWHVHGIETVRATEDLDISMQFPDWAGFHAFADSVRKLGFEPVFSGHPEKLIDPDTGQKLDILPFGALSEDGRSIVWPTDGSHWNILGFEEAYETSARMTWADGPDPGVRVATLPAMVLLKCIALYERLQDRQKKDGMDIGFTIKHYLNTGQKERLLDGPDSDIMNLVEGDVELAGCMLLGRDMGRMAHTATRNHVLEHLRLEIESSSRCPLAREVMSFATSGNFARARSWLRALLEGMEAASRA